ncbi:ribonucleoside-diphosphate reductase subunit alpha [Marinitenerispora sediminis]|uniref:Ribonucleoside-diphosphate reductase n=1 Tax=Marinitenerispora sediminis TaxID=1931232 RepID=A0A368T6Q3_9ACTN|nr:ribonucleoside-diphosphate reductase subunit alpha [Marinitenerispora sediminis]RCV50390.1 ribonucleoside-diphosphate reductase subunit alpha [Marinitenerispora sediminis]RCV53792.1 ribonucleoside-diphosphate reductase subunit alpha [Marinitenerispora sediminis]RCV56472.1 ribonucleoside-diphosphate reductase subunit alpha [Marinitenerispora sediminis]
MERVRLVVGEACAGLGGASAETVLAETKRTLYPGIGSAELELALIMAARAFVEVDPDYSYVSSRLLLDKLRREALSFLAGRFDEAGQAEMAERYPAYFADYVARGVELEQLDPELAAFDLARLGAALRPERDLDFTFLGMQTLYDRYFLHSHGERYELPQAFFMRVAMGLALREDDREARAIEFYELLSSFDFMCSTPTLFNSGTRRAQLSSCFLTTVGDDLHAIFHGISNNALLSKYSGGLGNDWTPVRGMGAHIKGTNGQSQGVVPFLKIANDTAVAVNQCFAPETSVYTADGVKAIKDVQVGDLVLGLSGTYREVLDVLAYDQVDPMVEVNVKHSMETLKVTTGHPFYAIKGVPLGQENSRTLTWLANDKVRPEWVDAGDLEQGDYVAQVIPKEVVPVEGFTEEDARLYGILLGDGHLSKDGMQWGVSGNPELDSHLDFVRRYLTERGIHFWESGRDDSYAQIHWSSGRGVLRDPVTGRITGTGAATLPFTAEDLYDTEHRKRISRRFSHLPRPQTRAMLQGLLETDGGVSRGVEIYFTTTSQPLAAGVRYQLLRMGIPSAGQYRERQQNHEGTRSDGSRIHFDGIVRAFDIRVPAVSEIADLVGCRPLTERNWIEFGGMVFSRVREVRETDVAPVVYDLKVETDESYMTAAGLVHNGGKRKGAVCAYLETWHIDIEEFLDLRKNTGDERRRTHDMNTANWVPDLFLQRVESDAQWTLFSPDEVPDLHDLYGAEFARRYAAYERAADAGEIKVWRRVRAVDLWRRMLTMLFETGHPWITFKDPCNLRSPQQHIGVVHSSNLCTEITLNTSADEVAVCNLGSVNLARHVSADGIDADRLRRTVRTAVRMLDNVIDVNFYTIPEAERANMRHRPVGLGLMGFQDALFRLRLPFGSDAAVEFADESMELISYHAIDASVELAAERGRYASFEGSLWSQGVLPIDSLRLLAEARGGDLDVDTAARLDWDALRERVRTVGMRNSNVMAIAPTATIANITGVSQSIEPIYRNLYVKSNMSGDFTVVNDYLVRDLKERGLWDDEMVAALKLHDGSLGRIERVPDDLRELYATAFEIDPSWLVDAGSRRQKWIDQAQSLNLYMAAPSGRKLDELYRRAWRKGLKTTYYLRSQSATHVEKSTLKGTDGKLNAVTAAPASSAAPVAAPPASRPPAAPVPAAGSGSAPDIDPDAGAACSIDDPDCEACQ